MKVGILTYYFGMNYGGQAQVYALSHFLKAQGHDCYIVAYCPDNYKIINLKMSLNIEPKWYMHPRQIWRSFKRMYNFSKFISKHKITKKIQSIEDIDKLGLDAIVIGSDEVVNCKHPLHTNVYLGVGIEKTPVVFYAPSSGALEVKHQLTEIEKKALERSVAVAGRDLYTCEFFKNNGCKDVEYVVDPTLLYNFTDLECDLKLRDYILLYSFEALDDYKDVIQNYAKENSLKIVSLGRYYKWADISMAYATENEWVTAYKYAHVVITDSFHGLMFTLKNKKDFVLLGRSDKLNKNNDVLERFKIKKDYYNGQGSIQQYLEKTKIDYVEVYKILEKEVEKSKDYLLRSLDKICVKH